MTRRRRTANPIFQKPLTYAELDKDKHFTIVPEGRQIVCSICKGRGARGLHKVGDDIYRCNDPEICERRKEMLAIGREKIDEETLGK